METAPVFEKTYRDYLSRVSGLELEKQKDISGIEVEGDAALVRLFGKTYRVSPKGIEGPGGKQPSHSISVVLCRYLIMTPAELPGNREWTAYRDFPDARPFVEGFSNTAERAIAKNFSGAPDRLADACRRLGGYPVDGDFSYDVALCVDALPRVPLLLLFNDRDEHFAASASVLFEHRARHFLDMECLAIVGWLFSDYLSIS